MSNSCSCFLCSHFVLTPAHTWCTLSAHAPRANLFMEAGANASFVEGARTVEELQEIGKQTKGLRVCNMMEGAVTPMCTPDELKAMGFNIIIHPVSGLYAATRALLNTYDMLASKGTTRGDLDKLVDFE